MKRNHRENLGHALIVARWGGYMVIVREPERPRPKWKLPGGKRKRNETPEDAARRELEEETGIRGDIPLQLISARPMPSTPGSFTQYLFVAEVPEEQMRPLISAPIFRRHEDEFFEVTSLPISEAFDHISLIPHLELLEGVREQIEQ